ncbi:hypothetical protein N0V93_000368 [Gnomoniopsis smithogilvyi]|uniref:Transcription factor gsfR2 n=1 Tax=Gnomoniopsis smithogilvyi TaxID=1191159 RepID=A0A9W8Z1T3_9PEZI|nr:hypothetical protein N0V93_000368 [Gnomoniopsis smithogilvyi]
MLSVAQPGNIRTGIMASYPNPAPLFESASRPSNPPSWGPCLGAGGHELILTTCLHNYRVQNATTHRPVSSQSQFQPCAESQYAAHVVSRDTNGEHGNIDKETTVDGSWTVPSEIASCPVVPWPEYQEVIQLDEGPESAFETIPEWPLVMTLPNLPLPDELYHDQQLFPAPSMTSVASIEVTSTFPANHTGYFDMETISAQLDSNLSYAVEKIKSAPSTMLQELQAPWCHTTLYKDELPRSMQDALSACALYASKNSVNSSIIMRCIDAKVNDLLASHVPADFLPALARVQALLLYQIIRFFDGDMLARSSADTTFLELRSSAQALSTHITWNPNTLLDAPTASGEATLFPLQASQAIWKRWVLQESARRTFLIACFFVRVWRLLTGRQMRTCFHDPPLLDQSWTLSAKMWQARDAVEFAAAWKERNHYIVKRGAILSTLLDANGEDIEVFGKMLLTVSMGVEEARAWLAVKGSSL